MRGVDCCKPNKLFARAKQWLQTHIRIVCGKSSYLGQTKWYTQFTHKYTATRTTRIRTRTRTRTCTCTCHNIHTHSYQPDIQNCPVALPHPNASTFFTLRHKNGTSLHQWIYRSLHAKWENVRPNTDSKAEMRGRKCVCVCVCVLYVCVCLSDENGCKIDTPSRHYSEQGRMSRFVLVDISIASGVCDLDELDHT